MSQQRPTLTTGRLTLRPMILEDAPAIQRLAGDFAVADNTLLIPYPYEDGMAEQWIGRHEADFNSGRSVIFAIILRAEESLIGAIGLSLEPDHRHAELGYWVGQPWWGRGCCTEAAGAVLAYGFEQRGLRRIFAHHFARNPASGRVMQKLGMTREGLLRQHVLKWDKPEDLVFYGILRDEFQTQQPSDALHESAKSAIKHP